MSLEWVTKEKTVSELFREIFDFSKNDKWCKDNNQKMMFHITKEGVGTDFCVYSLKEISKVIGFNGEIGEIKTVLDCFGFVRKLYRFEGRTKNGYKVAKHSWVQ